MTPTPQVNEAQAPSRISILARLIPALSYALPAIGAAVSALLYMGVIRAMRYAESAGIATVAGGMSEANIATVVSLYLAIIVGFAGIVTFVIRTQVSKTTATASGWFFLIAGILGCLPLIPLWMAQSLLIEVLFPSGPALVEVASRISLFLIVTPVAAVVSVLLLLAMSVLPLPGFFRAKGNLGPLLVLIFMELMLIGLTVAYHWRTSWLYNVRITERL